MHPVVQYCVATLHDVEQLVEGQSVDDYRCPCAEAGGGSIGQHLRHTLDHFRATLEVREGETLDYDLRERGTAIETDRLLALQQLKSLSSRLSSLSESLLHQPLRLRCIVSEEGVQVEVTSSLSRELAFCASHAVHHLALMATITRLQGRAVAEHFGVAPATLAHRHEEERRDVHSDVPARS